MHKRLVIRRPLLLLLSIEAMLELLLVLALNPSILMGAWLLFTLILFSLQGWLFVEFYQVTGGASPIVLLVTIPSLILIWLPLSLVAIFTFFGAALGQAFLRNRFLTDRRMLGDSLVLLFVMLVAAALVLLGLSTPTNVNPLILWAPAVGLGLAGWAFPEINNRIGRSAAAKPSSRSMGVFLLIAWAGLLEFLIMGAAYRYSILPGLLALLLFMLLRASIVIRSSTRGQQQ